LQELNVQPDTFTFSSVINAWTKSGDPSAVLKAEALLKQMQTLQQAGNFNVRPNTIIFTGGESSLHGSAAAIIILEVMRIGILSI
jgi:hypothetical protein